MPNFSILDFKKYKLQHKKITMVTAYDYLSAQLLEQAGIDTILVGDSLGMVIQGNQSTIGVKLDDILYHTKAVRKGAPNTFIIADMPYLSYHTSEATTISNAGALVCEGGANAVKVEINHLSTINHINALIAAQVPVIAHIGMTPQSINVFGGFKVQGKTQKEIDHILSLLKELEATGITALVLECIPNFVTKLIMENTNLVTIGIGAGNLCDGEVLVYHDLLGITSNPAKFVKPYLDGRNLIINSIKQFIKEVKNNIFPDINHIYK